MVDATEIRARLLQADEGMRRLLLLAALSIATGCSEDQQAAPQNSVSAFTATTGPIATIASLGADSLSDSASIFRVAPEPDGESVAFVFADPAKGIRAALGVVQVSGAQTSQLAWPDSVTSVWWSGPHELSFTAGTGQGVHVVVNAHAAQLEALSITEQTHRSEPPTAAATRARNEGLARAQAFIDSLRVQPEGNPQRSALRYQADSIIVSAGDTLAAVHVSAIAEGGKVNPAWYLLHIPSKRLQPIDSLVGRSTGLPPSGGQWDARSAFYYAKERSIWRATPRAQ